MSDAATTHALDQQPAAPPADPRVAELESSLEQARAELQQARNRVDELARAWQAGERDREAFKQRLQRERDQLLDVERGQVARTLLEAIDELELCVASGERSALGTGVRLIRDNLLRKLEGIGVTRIELVGRPYDPTLAEASDLELTQDRADDGKVLEVVKACYQLNGRVVRPGLVKVARYVKPADA